MLLYLQSQKALMIIYWALFLLASMLFVQPEMRSVDQQPALCILGFAQISWAQALHKLT